jgi:cytochrome c peroxidase
VTDEVLASGRALYESAEVGCASCHGSRGAPPDGDRHDVKSVTAGDTRRAFDTPSLRFVGGTAPYFHDGRYADLRTLLKKSDSKMGATKQLSPTELDALEAYVRSL